MKEKLQEYALLAEILSAVAIVISLLFVGMIRHGEMAFVQYENGFISESQLRSTLLPVLTSWSVPDMRQAFMFLSGFNEEYQGYVLSLVEDQ